MASLDPTSTGTASEKMVADYLGGTAANPVSVPVSGLTGATAASRYVGATTTGIPTTGTFAVGDFVLGQTEGAFYICTVAGSPGTWKNAARDVLMDGLGLKAWNFNPVPVNASVAATSQTIFAVAIPTTAGQTYAGVELWTSTAGTSTAPTGFYVGLASGSTNGATGTMLAQSSNLNASTSLTTTGAQTFAFSGTYTETATGLRSLVILQNGTFAGTNVAFARVNESTGNFSSTGGLFLANTAGTLQATLPATASPLPSAYSTSGSLAFWVALY